MYLLNVTDDGAQEVFRREAAFVQARFDRDLGTRSRPLSLINSRATAGQLPMATRTRMREVLQDVAAKIHRAEELSFPSSTAMASRPTNSR